MDVERRPWPVDPRYRAGDDGSILGPYGRVLRPWITDTGYQQIHVMVDGVRRGRTVHIIVCEAWHGRRPDGMEVAHGNGDQLDNRPANLRWKTRSANHADKVRHGTAQRGETANNRKLTEQAVREIRQSGASLVALAVAYGVTKSTIHAVRTGKSWRHVA